MFNRTAYALIALVALSASAANAIAEEHPGALVASRLAAPGTQHAVLSPADGRATQPLHREPSGAAMLLAVLGLGSFLAVRRINSNQ